MPTVTPTVTPAVLEGFAGAGGLSEGARMLGLGPALGYEVNADACATARPGTDAPTPQLALFTLPTHYAFCGGTAA